MNEARNPRRVVPVMDDPEDIESRDYSRNGPSRTDGEPASELEQERLREIRHEVETLIHQVLPEQAGEIDRMMDHFRGREEELVDTLQIMLERASNQKARADFSNARSLLGISPGAIESSGNDTNPRSKLAPSNNSSPTALSSSVDNGQQPPRERRVLKMAAVLWVLAAVFALAIVVGAVVAVRNNGSDNSDSETSAPGIPSPSPPSSPSSIIGQTESPSVAPTSDTSAVPSIEATSVPSILVTEAPTTPAPTALRSARNDVCSAAIGPLPLFRTEVGSTSLATPDSDVPSCGDATAVSTPSVWYTVTGTGFTMKASTCSGDEDLDDPDFSTQLTVLSGGSCQELECVGGNAVDNTDFCFFVSKSGVQWTSRQGELYYIVVHGRDAEPSGTFGLTITSEGVSTPRPTPAPVQPPSSQCFTTTEELEKAVDLYMVDPSSTTSSVALTYGYPIGTWCVSAVTDFTAMFSALRNQRMVEFNEDLSGWDMSNAVTIREMFSGAVRFNQDISMWNVENVADMSFFAYQAAEFNQDIGGWNVSKVTRMPFAFYEATSFNQDLSSWDIGQTANVQLMFAGASAFQQNLCAWGPQLAGQDIVNVNGLFDDTSCPVQETPDLDASPPGPFCTSCT